MIAITLYFKRFMRYFNIYFFFIGNGVIIQGNTDIFRGAFSFFFFFLIVPKNLCAEFGAFNQSSTIFLPHSFTICVCMYCNRLVLLPWGRGKNWDYFGGLGPWLGLVRIGDPVEQKTEVS